MDYQCNPFYIIFIEHCSINLLVYTLNENQQQFIELEGRCKLIVSELSLV